MNNDGKKIAFSITKVKKNALVNKVNIEPKEKIEYVDCFDGSKGKFSYKGNIRNDEVQKPELVIPMPVSQTSTDIVKARIEEKLNKNLELKDSNETGDKKKAEDNTSTEHQTQSIEELAVREILSEIKNGDSETKNTSNLIIESKVVSKEPSETDIDYDNIPVSDFGLAMLRGMGWKPGLGIGKEPRLVEAAHPKLRPKGLGLGAQPKDEADDKKKNEAGDKKKNEANDRKRDEASDRKRDKERKESKISSSRKKSGKY